MARRARAARPRLRRGELRTGEERGEGDRRHRRCHPPPSRRARCRRRGPRRQLSGPGQPRGQDVSVDLAADRARGWAAGSRRRGVGAWTSMPRNLAIGVEILPNRVFYTLGKEPGSGRIADRHQRRGALPAVRRDRLAGCRLPVDEAGLPRAVRPLPRVPDPVAGVARQDARDRRPADAPPVALAALLRALRGDPADDRALGAAPRCESSSTAG